MFRKADFQKNIYSLDTLKKAAYRYINLFSVEFLENDYSYTCILNFSGQIENSEADSYLIEYQKEVLDQDLRHSIKAETEATRNLILAHAFSKSGLIADE
jgi:His-Xaa-Ser system protein HxsD